MLIELGMEGFVSFQANLYPERLILVVASGDLRQLNGEEDLEPSGIYTYQDPMRGQLPQFCLHPYGPTPEPQEDGQTTWTWFSETFDGFWAIDLVLYKDKTWGCGISYVTESESLEEPNVIQEEEQVSLWLGLAKYQPKHHSQSQMTTSKAPPKKHGHTLN
jgi:hypothetical protein